MQKDVEIGNLFVGDVMCFNTLDNALHLFSPSLTFNVLCNKREQAHVLQLHQLMPPSDIFGQFLHLLL